MEIPHNPFERQEADNLTELLRRECMAEANGDATSYTNYLHQRYMGVQVREAYMIIAQLAQPGDPDIPEAARTDDDEYAGFAFYRGALLGLRVANEVIGPDFSDKLGNTGSGLGDVSHIDDPDKEVARALRRQAMAQAVANVGEIGYAKASEYHDLLEQWEDILSSDVRGQVYIKRGFGMVLQHVDAVVQKQKKEADLKQMQSEADTGVSDEDFDAFLRDLS